MDLLNNAGFRLMETALDAFTLRHRVTVNNIANGDTPGFKRSQVEFEELLNQATARQTIVGRRTDPRHIPIGAQSEPVTAKVVTDHTTLMNNNLNNVDIDYEMSRLAENQLRYNVVVQQVNYAIKHMKTAIGGGR